MAESPNPADDVTTAAGSDPQDFRCRGSQLVAGVCENPYPLAIVEKSSSLDQTPSVTSLSAGRATGPTRQQTRGGSTSEFDLIVSVAQLSCSKRRRLSAACLHAAMRFHLGSIPGQVSRSGTTSFYPELFLVCLSWMRCCHPYHNSKRVLTRFLASLSWISHLSGVWCFPLTFFPLT